ncbi:MAG TPA: hypothetical protein VFQ88_05860 [Nevskiaceae bacterium]|nr:hypothetical protein [Nevskiaceae bacterium]
MHITRLRAATAALALLPAAAWATNGYFTPGSSLQQLSMAGTGTAMAQDAGVAILNPAGSVWVGNQVEAGLSLFIPNRYYAASGTGSGANTGIFSIDPTRNGAIRSANTRFPMPEFVYNRQLDANTAIGVAMFGNGGMDTDYNSGSATFGANLPLGLTGIGALGKVLPLFQAHCQGTFGGGAPVAGSTDALGFCGNGRADAGVDLMQGFIAPYYSRKLTPTFSIGIEPIIAIQRFTAHGLAAFRKFSNEPNAVTDNGYSYSFGGGGRVGFLWKVAPGIGVGGSYQSRIYMTHFYRYTGLFAQHGAFDVPSSFNFGLQLRPLPHHRFLFDWQRINYHEVRSVGNAFDANRFVNQCAVPRLLSQLTGGLEGSTAPSSACLGATNGPGFAWRDMIIYKFGYQFSWRRVKLRLGYSFGRQPIPTDQMLFDVLAPGVVERHLTGGFAYELSSRVTVGFAFSYAFSHTIVGKNPLSNTPGSITLLKDGTPVGLHFDTAPNTNDQVLKETLREVETTIGFSYRFE